MAVTEEVCSTTSEAEDKTAVPQPSRFLARQPIMDVNREVIGYELLFRAGWENCFSGGSDEATRQTLDNCLFMGIESLAQEKLAFVNCTRESLVGGLVTLLPPKTTVLEILETIEPDEELIAVCKDLCSKGYRFALDDFILRPEMAPLIELASYVKVDFRLSDAAERKLIHEMVRGSKAALLAEKIEDQNEFDIAMSEGYQYFQGYFFCRPKVLANREIPPNRMNYLKLLVEMNRGESFDLRKVTSIVEVEASLCYRLLRMANSALWGVRYDITSVNDAFMVVGETRFRALVSVAASCVLSQNQPPALISMSLERARFCELLAPMVDEDPAEQFMLGLMSLLDAMLQTSMESITKTLPLRAEAKEALLGSTEPVALPLRLIRSLESGSWTSCESEIGAFGVTEETLAQLYMDSLKWANETLAVGA